METKEDIYTFDELLIHLKGLDIVQRSSEWEDDIPSEIWENHFNENYTDIANGLRVSKEKWYETSVSIIRIADRFLGISFISDMHGSSDIIDFNRTIGFFEAKEVQTTTYKEI